MIKIDELMKGVIYPKPKIKKMNIWKYIVAVIGIIIALAFISSYKNMNSRRIEDIVMPESGLSKIQLEDTNVSVLGDRYYCPSGNYSLVAPGEIVSSRNDVMILKENEISYVIYEGTNIGKKGFNYGFNSYAQSGESGIPKISTTERKTDVGFLGLWKVYYYAGNYEFEYKFNDEAGYYCYYAVELDDYCLYVMAFLQDSTLCNNAIQNMKQVVMSLEEIDDDNTNSSEYGTEEHSNTEVVSREITVSYNKDYEETYFVASYIENGEQPSVVLMSPDGTTVEPSSELSNNERHVFVIEDAERGDYVFNIQTSKGRFVTGIECGAYSKTVYKAMYEE